MNFLTVSKIYTVSRDGAVFVWSCSKDINDVEMKDKNYMDEGSGLKTFLKLYIPYIISNSLLILRLCIAHSFFVYKCPLMCTTLYETLIIT